MGHYGHRPEIERWNHDSALRWKDSFVLRFETRTDSSLKHLHFTCISHLRDSLPRFSEGMVFFPIPHLLRLLSGARISCRSHALTCASILRNEFLFSFGSGSMERRSTGIFEAGREYGI